MKMKHCYKCGNPMEDDMLFCQRCGTKFVEVVNQKLNESAPTSEPIQTNAAIVNKTAKPRKGMKVGMTICIVFAAMYVLIGIGANMIDMAIGMGGFFLVLAGMFFVLSRSPKDNPYILNMRVGIKKGVFVLICIFCAFMVVVVGISTGSSNASSSSTAANKKTSAVEPKQETVVIDVEKFANISAGELVALLGEPSEISDGTCSGSFEIPCVYYDYTNAEILGEVSFVLVNDKVVRFTSYSEYAYDDKNDILAQYGITKDSSCVVAADTNVALRYRCPSAKVDDFWINLIDGDVFEFLQITYDMEYYDEWYLPLTSSEEIDYKTNAELTMKSVLTAPGTVDFPWYDWQYGKNLFYIAVSSYVDSQNAFGAEIRNTFTFIYSRQTGELVLAIVNDEVIANNGYVATNELIQQLYQENATA